MQRIPQKTLKKTKSIIDPAMEEFNKEMASMYEQIQKDIESAKRSASKNKLTTTVAPEPKESDKLEDVVDKLYREMCEMYPVKSTDKPRDTSSKKPYMNRKNNDAHTSSSTPKINSLSCQKNYPIHSTSKKVTFSDFKIRRSSSKHRRSSDKFCSKKLFSSEKNMPLTEKRRLQLQKQDKLCSKMIFSPGIDSLQNSFNVETINNTNLNKSSDNKENIADDENILKDVDSSGEFRQLEIACASPTTPTNKTKKLTTINENHPNSLESLMSFVINENTEAQQKITKFVTDTFNETNAKIAAKFAEFQEKYGQIPNSIKSPLQTKKVNNLRVNTLKKTIEKKNYVPDTPRTNRKMTQAIGMYNSMRCDLDSPKREKSMLQTPLATKNGKSALSIKLQKQCLALVD